MAIFRGVGGAGEANDDATLNAVTEQAQNAAESASEAATSATSAASSATTATTKASEASTSASNAASSASSASTSATAAASSATAAASSASAAASSESHAASSEGAAASSATAAATSATNAAASETAASTSAGVAALNATSSASSASSAATSATNAATSETNAANSASSASTSASQAATSATSAAASAASAAATYDAFDDRYLGAKSSDPTVDNDGNALIAGALYFNTTASEMRTYDGSLWIAASSASIETMDKFKYTASASQTAFTGLDDGGNTMALTVGAEIVTLNGVVLEQGTDYTATSDTITLTSGAAASDELNIYAFGNFTVADTVSKSSGGTFDSVVNFTDGLTTSANITFGDNDKAIFGAGSDLQIYHDGTKNWIRSGTSDIEVRVNGGGNFKVADEFGNLLIQANDNSDVILFHNAATKLATTSTGIDVTGTVTADGLTVDGVIDMNPGTLLSATSGTNQHITVDYNGTPRYGWRYDSGVQLNLDRNNAGWATALNVNLDNGDISFYEDTGTTAKFFWDASAESLGIGTSSPNAKADLVGGDVTGGLKISQDTTTSAFFSFGADANETRITSSSYGGYKPLTVHTGGTERMRITSDGDLLVGTTGVIQSGKQTTVFNGQIRRGLVLKNTHTDANMIGFVNSSNTIVGQIYSNATSTAYNTSSDYRLKTDVQPMTGATERLKALKPVNFEWISSGERVDGFLAHEAAEVVPEAVTGEKDAMRTEEYEVTPAVLDDDGNVVTEAVMGEREVPDYQGIDQSKLVPLLTSALQEAIARIETLEAEVTALKGA